MKRLIPAAFLVMLTCFYASAQNNGIPADTSKARKPAFGIHFGGYVKTDVLYDTRQVVGARDNQFLFYPEPVKPDEEGNDINARSEFNILAIQSRLSGTISAPDALGAKTSGFIEAEFFGNINQNINVFRLRHAYLKLNWPKTEFLAGQTWHPMFSPLCFPNTVSFNTGVMFAVFSRNPQLRVTRSIGPFSVSLAALSQIDFTSNGPDGPSSKYARNATIPELDIQLMYRKKDDASGKEFLLGAGMNYLVLLPRLASTVTLSNPLDTVINGIVIHQPAVTATYKTSQTVSAFAWNIMAKLVLKKVSFKLGGYYGGNSYGYCLLGGYAVKSVTDPVRGILDYATTKTFTAWGEIASVSKKWQPGIFAGFSRNLGTGEVVKGPFYSRGSDIDYLYRISPRLIRDFNKFRISGEIEYTAAAFGKTNEKGYVFDTEEVGNLRILLGFYYFF